jgi:phenylalanyl-tRNA synthetase beta chain
MKIPESWLRAYCNPAWTSEQLADHLTMAGLEVEESKSFAPSFSKVVVGQVLSFEKHPNADKLNVCQVETGQGVQQIVCGAPNVSVGIKIPCALPGALLPNDFAIKPVVLRGVASNGMLCSATELGLTQDHEGLLILPTDAKLGQDFREYGQLDDQVLTLKLTPNLAHCLSVYGVARELSAISRAPLEAKVFKPAPVTLNERVSVKVEAPDLCGRFAGRIVRGVNAKASTPMWMRDRLERAGQRSISALVDISNYVMLEMGRPTHVFDLDKIHGGLTVRWAKPGETLKLLNGQTVSLDQEVGIIADEQSVESLAGIMGGDSTAVSLETTSVYLEAAFWWPTAVAGRSRRFNFATDAGHRFERGVDPVSTADHLEYLTTLVLDICGGQAGPLDDQCLGNVKAGGQVDRPDIQLRADRARKLIGANISNSEMAEVFDRLGLKYQTNATGFSVSPPSYRFDMSLEEDLVEEIARIWGYNNLPKRPPVASLPMRPRSESKKRTIDLKRAIAGCDFQEIVTYSFVDARLDGELSGIGKGEGAIALLNPIASNLDGMRTTLWTGLLATLKSNLSRKASRVRIFEMGSIFRRNPDALAGPLAVKGIDQPRRVAALAYGSFADDQWGIASRGVDFFDLKGDVEKLFDTPLRFEAASLSEGLPPALHPGKSAKISRLTGEFLGWMGELHPKVQQTLGVPMAPILWELDADALLQHFVAKPEALSKYPPVIRDFAVVVPLQATAGQILAGLDQIRAQRLELKAVKYIKLFDEYRGKGLENKEKSLAFRVFMQDTERTLSDVDASNAIDALVAYLEQSIGARLRQ